MLGTNSPLLLGQISKYDLISYFSPNSGHTVGVVMAFRPVKDLTLVTIAKIFNLAMTEKVMLGAHDKIYKILYPQATLFSTTEL